MSEAENTGSPLRKEQQPAFSAPLIEDTSQQETYHKGFNYFVQNENGHTDIWDTMINNIKPTGKKELKGGFFSDGTICWTNEETTHFKIITESTKHAAPQSECRFTFEARYPTSEDKPIIFLNTFEQEDIDRFMRYFARCVNPDTRVKVMAIQFTGEELNGRKLTKDGELDLNQYREQQ